MWQATKMKDRLRFCLLLPAVHCYQAAGGLLVVEGSGFRVLDFNVELATLGPRH